jgi:multiple sugar transport system permease protein
MVGGRIALYVLVAVLGATFALPLLWLALAPWSERVSLTVSLPAHPTLQNFRLVFANQFATHAILNSVILAVGIMVLATLAATLGAYALSRARIPHYEYLVYGIILFSSIDSGTAAIVPVFLLANALHLVNTYLGVILVSTGGAIPGAVFIMRGFVEGLPRSYEESSLVAGAGPLTTLRRVVVPLLRPGMMVVAIWVFVNAWGNFLTPFILLRNQDLMPASVAIYSFYTDYGLPIIPLTAAYSLLYAAPVILLYLLVNWRYGFRFFGGIRG